MPGNVDLLHYAVEQRMAPAQPATGRVNHPSPAEVAMQARGDEPHTVAVAVPLWIPMVVLAAIAIGIIWLVAWLRGRRE